MISFPASLRTHCCIDRTCVVEMSLLLHTVLHKTGQYKRATEVADLVASERLGVYALFSKEDMSRLLEAVR